MGCEFTISASEVADVCNLNPYGSPMRIYLRKLGLIEPEPDNRFMKWGRLLEPLILDEYRKQQPADETIIQNSVIFRHDNGWLTGTPDALVFRNVELIRGVEAKSGSAYQRKNWTETDIPPAYLVQCATYMAILKVDRWDVARLLGGNDFLSHVLERDQKLETIILDTCEQFLENLQARIPPPLDASPWAERYLKVRYAEDLEPALEATEEQAQLALQLRDVRDNIKKLEEEEAVLSSQIKNAIGNAAGLYGSGFEITWKKTKDRERTDWQALAQSYKTYHVRLARFTATEPGPRRFVAKYKEES